MCKPWKVNGVNRASVAGEKFSDFRRRVAGEDQVREASRSSFS
jgi:hypothetical protein